MPFPAPLPGLPLAFLLAAAPQPEIQPALQSCPVPVVQAVETASTGACRMTHCAAPLPNLSVCRCIGGPANSSSGWTATYTVKRGQDTRQWSRPLDDLIPEQMGPMDVALADLSGTGSPAPVPSLVIAELDAVSNGVGLHSWTLTLLEPQPPFRRLAHAETAEYGPGTLARRLDGKPGCDLLIATAEEDCRGDTSSGILLSGRWMRLQPDGLRPLASRPPPPRRYVSADDLAGAPGDDRGRPAAWFSTPGPDQRCPAGSR